MTTHEVSQEQKHIAGKMVRYHVSRGYMDKPDTCSQCGIQDVPLEGHHDDYTKPFAVTWLCRNCHKQVHSILRVSNGIHTNNGRRLSKNSKDKLYQYHLAHPEVSYRKVARIWKTSHQTVSAVIRSKGLHEEDHRDGE